jgi:diadenosine tetraphosphate (Ap4A) HIT family hydrolase
MNQNFKIIESGETKIGVATSPITGGTIIVIEDNVTRSWIDLSKEQLQKLKENLNKIENQ